MEYYATCPKGFEALLADELRAIGVHRTRALRGRVAFFSDVLADAYRACLWSRLASRIVLVLGRGPAADADDLYDTVRSIPWEDHLPRAGSLAVDAHGTNPQLRNTHFTEQRTKDAIVDRLVERHLPRPSTRANQPDLTVVCSVSKDHATIGLDLSGGPLFRRGGADPRNPGDPLPGLRPDYASALLAAGGWYRCCRRDAPTLASLYSGAGAVVVEALLQARDVAPGLGRARWGFERWLGSDGQTWNDLLEQARAREAASRGDNVTVVASDPRRGADRSLAQALRRAGQPASVTFVSPGKLPDALDSMGTGALMACDLSWLGTDSVAGEASALSELRNATSHAADAESVVVLTRTPSIDRALGTDPSRTIDVYLGRDEGTIRTYDPRELATAGKGLAAVGLKAGGTVPLLVPGSEQFVRRLEKVARTRARWARRELVSCYRVYDSDLPDYAVSIDLYNGEVEGERWLSVSEYAAPREVDPDLAHARLMDVLACAPRVLGVRPSDTFLRVRAHGRGGSQYASEPGGAGTAGSRRPSRPREDALALPPGAQLIEEGGLTFEVNFSSRLDCGIFLDHRETRGMLREMAKQMRGSRRFLNLFAYTGTATCYAADGGARHTTTVDMSRPSLEWAWRNMERNGFSGPSHEYVQADVLAWVREQRHSPNRWDLIFCDAPTFSNSSRMHGSWDVQRDHVELLITLSRLLIQGGTCVFSCNLRSFRPEVDALAHAGVSIEDITARTIPEDFARNPKIHHCYLVRRA